MQRAKEIISEIASKTDSIILMHSLSGKDSIALLDLCAPYFRRIVCVFMYTIPNMQHIDEYRIYAERRYPNTEWIQVPHYCIYTYIRTGYMGCTRNEKQRKWRLTDIIEKIKERTGIEWVCLGFKQNDSLNRRLMLRSYKDGKESISYAGKKFYPLSTYSNKDVLEYISSHHLKSPETYGSTKGQSNGCDISNYLYLKYLQENYPEDLMKVYNIFPRTQFIIQEYEQKNRITKKNGDKTEFDSGDKTKSNNTEPV